MRAILSAPGSRGDVNPMIAIGRELHRRGLEVFISLAEPYAHLASEAGLTPRIVFAKEEFDRLLGTPQMWKPIRGIRGILRELMVPMIDRHLRVLDELHRPGNTVLVSHPLDLASRLFRDSHPDTRLVDIHLAPAILRSPQNPPRLAPWQPLGPPWLIRSAFWLADRWAVDPVLRPALSRHRSGELEPTARRVLKSWWMSPDIVLAMYPRWFAPSLLDQHPGVTPVGFPLDDGVEDDSESAGDPKPDVDDPPIVFTSGTAHHHTRSFFQHAAQVCERLGRPGLLLTTFADNVPDRLPPGVQACGYVSLQRLLPRSAAIVHHGGIGTTSAALAAGIPQVIRPLAYDQFDNADRVAQLRCGQVLRRETDLQDTLTRVLRDADAGHLQGISDRCRSRDAVGLAVDQILGPPGRPR